MKRLFGRKKQEALKAREVKAPVDYTPGVYSDAMIWAASKLNQLQLQSNPGF